MRGDQPGGERPRTGDADLLSEHRAHEQFRPVDVAGSAQPGAAPYERGEQGISTQVLVDRLRVAVEVEQAPGPLDR